MTPTPRPARSVRSDINITPLIDIVLVLLIVFIIMVPTLSKVLSAAIPQTAPTGEQPTQTETLVVSLNREGQLLLQQTPLERAQLVDQLVPVLLRQPIHARKVCLKVDGEQSHGQAVAIMDLLRQADERVQAQSRAQYGLEGPDTRIVMAQAKGGDRR